MTSSCINNCLLMSDSLSHLTKQNHLAYVKSIKGDWNMSHNDSLTCLYLSITTSGTIYTRSLLCFRYWYNIIRSSGEKMNQYFNQTDLCLCMFACFFFFSNYSDKGTLPSSLVETHNDHHLSANIGHIFTFYVISPQWYDTCSWNPS